MPAVPNARGFSKCRIGSGIAPFFAVLVACFLLPFLLRHCYNNIWKLPITSGFPACPYVNADS